MTRDFEDRRQGPRSVTPRSVGHGDVPPHDGMVLVEAWGYCCERCDHAWIPREKDRLPKVCPLCKSPYWNKPRRPGNWPVAKRSR